VAIGCVTGCAGGAAGFATGAAATGSCFGEDAFVASESLAATPGERFAASVPVGLTALDFGVPKFREGCGFESAA